MAKRVLCPYFKTPCKTDGCEMWGTLTGHAENGAIINENGCILKMNTSIMLRVGNMVSQQTASVDKMSNEIDKMHATVAKTNVAVSANLIELFSGIKGAIIALPKGNGSMKQIEGKEISDE